MGKSLEIISSDEDYILGKDIGDENYTNERYFDREPNIKAFKYSKIAVGDIIYEGASKSPLKHAAFVYKTNQNSFYGEYVQTVEAVAGGVQYGFLDDTRMVDFGVSIYRVYRAGELGVVQSAREFIKEQIGKPYSTDFTKTKTDINSSKWYCSELIFAAYYYGRMEICSNRDFEFNPDTMPCLPIYLTRGLMNMHVITDTAYLYISIDSFADGLWNKAYWKIKITNLNYFSVNVEYNTKMCNLDDAKNWTNLKDTVDLNIDAGVTKTVNIYQNWFATSITVSYIFNGYRYITYGTELGKVTNAINVGNQTKKI